MIDLVKFTPIEYSKQSRDFQVLCRLYTILYNNVKMYADSMNIWNSKIDNKLVSLKSRTVNFIPKHIWDLNELKTVASCFKYLCRNKGTVDTLYYCINILMKVQGLNDKLVENAITYDNGYITIRMNSNIVSIGVIEDLIEYLIPAGCTYRIIKYAEIDAGAGYSTEVFYDQDSYERGEDYIYSENEDKMIVGNSDISKSGINRPNKMEDTVVYSDKLFRENKEKETQNAKKKTTTTKKRTKSTNK